MSDVMMKALQIQNESLTRQVEQLGPENERVRKLLTEFDRRHDIAQAEIERLQRELAEERERCAKLRPSTYAIYGADRTDRYAKGFCAGVEAYAAAIRGRTP